MASGPYMLAGSEGFDFSRAPTKQRLPSGYVFNKRITLVRNPAWRNDPLRAAYVDRIVLTFEGPADKAAAKVDQGRLDVALGQLVPTAEQVERYRADPALEKRLFAHVGNAVRYISLNLAVPPFDDVHVRKAVNLAIDKQALRRTARGGLGGRIAGHIAPDALLNNLLLDYDPYETPGGRGDLEAAQGEMAKSRYDRDHDGVCDAPACSGLLALVRNDDPAIPRLAKIVADNLRPIGIELDVKAVDPDTYFGKVSLPQSRLPVVPALGLSPDTLNGTGLFSVFYGPLVGGPSGYGLSGSLVGATAATAREVEVQSDERAQRRRQDRGVPSPDRRCPDPVLGRDGSAADGDGRAVGALPVRWFHPGGVEPRLPLHVLAVELLHDAGVRPDRAEAGLGLAEPPGSSPRRCRRRRRRLSGCCRAESSAPPCGSRARS